MSRSAFASQRPRPRTVCWRHGPGSPAASARIQPVLRRSSLSRPSRNRPADTAARSCANSGRIRAFTSRSEDAQSSSVVSIDAPAIHDSPNHGDPSIQRSGDSATVMLGFELEFDLIENALVIRVSDGGERRVELGAGNVAAFYGSVLDALKA